MVSCGNRVQVDKGDDVGKKCVDRLESRRGTAGEYEDVVK